MKPSSPHDSSKSRWSTVLYISLFWFIRVFGTLTLLGFAALFVHLMSMPEGNFPDLDGGTKLILAAAGSSITLASMSFSYARCFGDKTDKFKYAVQAGESLIQAASLFFLCSVQRYLPALTSGTMYLPAKEAIKDVIWGVSSVGVIISTGLLIYGFITMQRSVSLAHADA